MLYRFDICVLDTDRRELRRGATSVAVEPQVFDVLVYLITHRDRVVTRDDLLAAVWDGRIVSESTLSSRINLARVSIGDNGDDQRLIRTVLRRGFRFVGEVQEEQSRATPTAAAPAPVEVLAAKPAPHHPVILSRHLAPPLQVSKVGVTSENEGMVGVGAATMEPPPWSKRASWVGFGVFAGAALATIAGATLFMRSPAGIPSGGNPRAPVAYFDAGAVPLVNDAQRRSLASYSERPNVKAIAIAYDTVAIVDGLNNAEAAKEAALQQCRSRTNRICRLYALGMDVFMSPDTVPLPSWSDLRQVPMDSRLLPNDVPLMRGTARKVIDEQYMRWPSHKALAITTGGLHFTTERRSRAEAARLAVEGCAESFQRPCMIISVDAQLTMYMPKSRKLDRIFLPSIEMEIPLEHRARLAETYRGAEWRALATGKNGAWEAVSGAGSEQDAIAGALEACGKVDRECRLYAIGNFIVARE